jgi:ribosomal-protein-alanine N-acetyltransferase
MTASGLWLEAGGVEDAEALAEIERASFSHPWTLRNFQDALRQRGVFVLRAPRDPGDASRGIRAYCALRLVAGELQVHDLAVHPGHRGRGLARWLLEFALAWAGRQGADEAYLEVRQSNQAARALYRSLGFQEVSTRREYYRNPTEDALLLRKTGLRDAGPAALKSAGGG